MNESGMRAGSRPLPAAPLANVVDLRRIAFIAWLNRMGLGVLFICAWVFFLMGTGLLVHFGNQGPLHLRIAGYAFVALLALNVATLLIAHRSGEYDQSSSRLLLCIWLTNFAVFAAHTVLLAIPGGVSAEVAMLLDILPAASADGLYVPPIAFFAFASSVTLVGTVIAWKLIAMRAAPDAPHFVTLRKLNKLHGSRAANDMLRPRLGVPTTALAEGKFDLRSLRRYHAVHVISALSIMIFLIFLESNNSLSETLKLWMVGLPALIALFWSSYHVYQFFSTPSQTALEALRNDKRSPVVWLRSFIDEAEGGAQDIFTRRSIWWLFWMLDSKSRSSNTEPETGRLEQLIVDKLRDVGPVVGLGNPRDISPEAGIARAYLKGDDWKSSLLALLEPAELIVALAGPTAGLEWELEEIAKRGLAERLIVILPDGDKELRIDLLRGAFSRSPWADALGSADVARSTVLAFAPEGRLICCQSNFSDQVKIEAALIYGMHASLTNRQAATARAA